ncbi:Calpain-like protease palB rim-13 [Fusarium mundagurra]|uniref:Calpain-like protease palB rim-13 n=1 Tax=Fusarium mundagurra TaxID=1567541 RepID=A0A8H6D182_9HYPO|nr:Calpain-like protease palB rim-13 [Fusarium mundagurra]
MSYGDVLSNERPAQRRRTDDHPEYSLPPYGSPASGHPSASPSGLPPMPMPGYGGPSRPSSAASSASGERLPPLRVMEGRPPTGPPPGPGVQEQDPRTANVKVQVPADAAERLRMTLSPFQLSDGEEVRHAQLSASWLTQMSVTARSATSLDFDPSKRHSSALTVRVSVAYGWDPVRVTTATSGDGDYEELKTIVQTPELDMEPARIQREGMWLVIESMGAPRVGQCIEIEIHSDGPLNIGPWVLA